MQSYENPGLRVKRPPCWTHCFHFNFSSWAAVELFCLQRSTKSHSLCLVQILKRCWTFQKSGWGQRQNGQKANSATREMERTPGRGALTNSGVITKKWLTPSREAKGGLLRFPAERYRDMEPSVATKLMRMSSMSHNNLLTFQPTSQTSVVCSDLFCFSLSKWSGFKCNEALSVFPR